MGNLCVQPSITHNVGVTGNHNIALIWNGVSYNFTTMVNDVVDQVNQQYKDTLVWCYISFLFSMLVFTLFNMLHVGRCKYSETSRTA